ncbi:MAG: ribonuclease P protein component [Acutalibacteraceae bacterium]
MSKPPVINRNTDFRRIYWRGRSAAHPVLVTYAAKSRGEFTRVGVTSGKKVGNAVTRNRARRVIRAAYRNVMPKIRGSWDIVFVARGKTPHTKSTRVEAVMTQQLEQLGIIERD